jgi:hypothetical protein
VDQRQESGDGLGELDKLGQPGAAGPGQPAGQQRPAAFAVGGEEFAELF